MMDASVHWNIHKIDTRRKREQREEAVFFNFTLCLIEREGVAPLTWPFCCPQIHYLIYLIKAFFTL